MNTKHTSYQAGFSVVEILIVLVVLALAGFVGWKVYDQHKSAPTNTTQTASTTDPYAGWQHVCSDYGSLCLKYPSSWTVKTTSEPTYTEANTGAGLTESGTTNRTSIVSPSGKVQVTYSPSEQGPLTAGSPSNFNVLALTAPTTTTGFKVVKGVSTWTSEDKTITNAHYYLTTSDQTTTYKLVVGDIKSDGMVADNAAYFINVKKSHPDVFQLIGVYPVGDDTTGNYENVAAARAWLNSDEVKTGGQILASVYYAE